MASREREVILPLCAGEASPGVLHPDMESSGQEKHGPVGAHLEKGHRHNPGIEHLCENRLIELGPEAVPMQFFILLARLSLLLVGLLVCLVHNFEMI